MCVAGNGSARLAVVQVWKSSPWPRADSDECPAPTFMQLTKSSSALAAAPLPRPSTCSWTFKTNWCVEGGDSNELQLEQGRGLSCRLRNNCYLSCSRCPCLCDGRNQEPSTTNEAFLYVAVKLIHHQQMMSRHDASGEAGFDCCAGAAARSCAPGCACMVKRLA